ncbi:MAG: single-stranded-DNA-specific exonuclease RecJ [Leptolinea sp.]
MQQREWHIQPILDAPAELLASVNQNGIAANYLIQRGITSPQQVSRYLEPDPKNLTDPFDLPDMKPAVNRILQALESGEVIGIWGDFDVDGQTSTAILVECLTRLGGKAHHYLPVREKESHGIAIPSLQVFLQKGIQLLISCDTGISAHAAVQYANAHQVDVIITDHHTLPEDLPPALACINPRRLPDEHPLATLSGSATAFELMLAVCRKKNLEEIALQSIDLAALGLIADMAPLQKDARLITQLGLQRLTQKPRAWIQALMTAANLKSIVMDEQTVGYLIAPRLNSFGRLGDANPLVCFLMDSDLSELPGIAQKLEQLNADRRWLSNQVGQSAMEQYNHQPDVWNDPIIVLANPTWPGGVLGLAANRLVSEFNRPTILFNESTDGVLSGSARSVAKINITEAITASGHLLNGFGGHPMAAGMSLSAENLPEFRRSLNNWAKEKGLATIAPPALEIDTEIAISSITANLFTELNRLSPFGNGNPSLIFCMRSVQIVSSKSMGRSKEHYKFILEDQVGKSIPAVWWGADIEHVPSGRFDLAFSLRENKYLGKSTLQAEWIDFQPVEDAEIRLTPSTGFQIEDLRRSVNPLKEAKNNYIGLNYLVFQEPPVLSQEDSAGRLQLSPVENLIMASIPSSTSILEKAIQSTHPKKVILAFDAPATLSPQGFLKHLSGLIQYAISNRNGLANMNHLAQAVNARVETISAGIAWLVSAGKIKIIARDQDLIEFSIENHPEDSASKSEAENKIAYLLKETAAYQKSVYSLPEEDINNLLSGFLKPSLSNKKKV